MPSFLSMELNCLALITVLDYEVFYNVKISYIRELASAMDPAELRYRALLAVVYWELTKDLDGLHIFYEQTESCVSMASAAAALRLASGLRTEAASLEEAEEVDYGLVLAGPYREGLGELALNVLRLIRKTAVLHTPVYFAVSELGDFQEMARNREIRYAVREMPGEIAYYKLVNGNAEMIGVKKLNRYEQLIIRMYESEHL